MAGFRIGVLISGRGSNLQALIDAAAEAAYPAEIALVVSNVPGAAGLDRAAAAGIPRQTIDHRDYDDRAAFDAAVDAALRAAGVELVCLAGFMRLLGAAFVERWPNRIINIHPSLLPAFKGLDVHEQVLAAGVRISGCTVHYVVPEVDAGPIVAQAAVPVVADDTAATLAARVLAAEHRIYPLAVRLIAEGRVLIGADGTVRIDGQDALAPALLNPLDSAAVET
ncbi:MAG: phosphoribosylglycinamide formyltransferase [Alphaproteobacteria bacterium]|jgi:phosphoribosylglycinamide formyltransferase-1|nr:phosphoribosylglycinamide formyltransferase [Alphaproteobacteria bacterium]